jgi:thiamine-phosphate pyrophosphorylase
VKAPRILLVTDPSYTEAHIEGVVVRVGAALATNGSAAFGVLLRDKQRSRAAVVGLAERLRAATSGCGASLIVHSDASLALAVKADGVHLGGDVPVAGGLAEARRALPSAWLSVAAHTDADVERAVSGGADAVLVSPIYETPGKGPARGVAALASARALAPRLAIYALGGVVASRVGDCKQAGATGVAVIRALLAAKDPVAVARKIYATLDSSSPSP